MEARTAETAVAGEPLPEAAPGAQRRAPLEARVAEVALALLPGALTIYFGFNGGGFFPGSVAFMALFVTQCLLLRILLAERPLAGVSGWLAFLLVPLGLLTGWALLSGSWSHATDRSMIEFDRLLLYLGCALLFALVPRERWRTLWMVRGIAAGMFVVAGAGVITRLLPHVWPTAPNIANNRLSFPVTYWNALGIVAVIGLLLMVGLASTDRSSRLGRALACAGVPLMATALYLTFSRGAIGALLVGLVAFVVVARPRNILGTLFAVLPPTVVVLIFAYNADALATTTPTSPRGVTQGGHVATALAICALVAGVLGFLLAPLDGRARDWLADGRRRRLTLPAWGAAAVIAVVVALVAGAPGFASREYHRFVNTNAISTDKVDLRQRLTDPSNNSRLDHWHAAAQPLSTHLLNGTGAGTYQYTWARYRRQIFTVIDAHSLYMQTLSELGLVGLVLLAAAILAILVALALRASGPDRVLWAGLFAAAVAWAVHAGVDWDWQMPVTTLWLFAAGGAALAAARISPRAPVLLRWRVPLAICLLLVAVAPALVMLSQSRLQTASADILAGDCAGARSAAFSSISVLAVRPQAYQVLGYCDMADGRATDAVAAMQKAVDTGRGSWEYHYGLALAQALAGQDPSAQFRETLRLNPHEPFVVAGVATFIGLPPSGWERASQQARLAALASGQLSFR